VHAVSLGHEIVSVLAVLSAFFTGMALGAWVLHRSISEARRPALWYAALEAVIGLWGLTLVVLLPVANTWTAALLGTDPTPLQHWVAAFGLPLTALFVTGALGIGSEVLVVRVLSQILENTVYSFAALLVVSLAGTAAAPWPITGSVSGRIAA
jgi:spermidine synthase